MHIFAINRQAVACPYSVWQVRDHFLRASANMRSASPSRDGGKAWDGAGREIQLALREGDEAADAHADAHAAGPFPAAVCE